MNTRYTRATLTGRQTIGDYKRPLNHDIVRRRFIASHIISRRLAREPIFTTRRHRLQRLQWIMQSHN